MSHLLKYPDQPFYKLRSFQILQLTFPIFVNSVHLRILRLYLNVRKARSDFAIQRNEREESTGFCNILLLSIRHKSKATRQQLSEFFPIFISLNQTFALSSFVRVPYISWALLKIISVACPFIMELEIYFSTDGFCIC